MTKLEELPDRMDRLELQIVQLRAEMHDEFSAIRGQMREAGAMIVTALMEQIEQSRRETRVLFEESLARIATIQEHLDTRRKKKR